MTTPPGLTPTTDDDTDHDEPERHRPRDVAGAAALTVGVAVLVYAAFLTALTLGMAAVGVVLIAGGVALAYEPPEPRPARPTRPPAR